MDTKTVAVHDILTWIDNYRSPLCQALRSTVLSLDAVARTVTNGHVSTIAPDGLKDVCEILGINPDPQPYVCDETIGYVVVYRGPQRNFLLLNKDDLVFYKKAKFDGVNGWGVEESVLEEARSLCKELNDAN